MTKLKVYIASPYTIGSKLANVDRSMQVANELINLGFAPFIPLLNHFQNNEYPQPEKIWLSLDLDWVESCHCVLRLGGESTGADNECDYADKLAMPVFRSVEQIVNWRDSRNGKA